MIRFKVGDNVILRQDIDANPQNRNYPLYQWFSNWGLLWQNLSACTTDGAPAMLGCNSGFRGRVQSVNPNVKHLHCMLHRYVLAVKTMPLELKNVLDDVIKIVNHIKKSPLNSRIFYSICEEFGSDEKVLLYHTEVRWLSKGNVLSRVHIFEKLVLTRISPVLQLSEFQHSFRPDSSTTTNLCSIS
ncbi:protein ZBED8-like [Octopus sinensis]|uniref:Protein ZBED8-like n=1 Tax=Octopus sinensis TaxID=2607531 RepID=A0A6P7TWR9_9MOLL|nr:protein ZBED8-like [Octopus sinensis]